MSTYPVEFSQLEKENAELTNDFETIEIMYNALKPVNRHLQSENEKLKKKIKIVCIGIKSPDFETKKKSMAEGIMSIDLSKPDVAFHCGWEMAMLECGEILSKP